jgi:hypothetical protein
MKRISLFVLLALFVIFPATENRSQEKDHQNEPKADEEPVIRSHSFSKTEVYSSSNRNGKKRTNYSKNESEEHRLKRGNRPAQVRRYWEKWHRKNGGNTKIMKKAYSNVKGEKKILRNRWRKGFLTKNEEKVNKK